MTLLRKTAGAVVVPRAPSVGSKQPQPGLLASVPLRARLDDKSEFVDAPRRSPVGLSAAPAGITGEVKGEARAENGSVRGAVKAEITGTSEVHEEGGRRRWTTTAKATVSGEAGAEGKGKVRGASVKGSVSGTAEVSTEVTYDVSVPVDAKPERSPAEISPWAPESMPVGTVVSLDSEVNASWEVSGSGAVRAGIWGGSVGVSYGESGSRGVTVRIEKTSETKVKVSVGPTESQGRHGSVEVGGSVGPVEATVGAGSSSDVRQSRVREVEFDLATPEGKAAYEQFLATGELPAEAGPGVSGTTVVETRHAVTGMELKAELGIGDVSVGGTVRGEAVYDTTTTTHPDGTREVAYRERLPGSDASLVIKQVFGPDGKEDVSRREYRVEVEVTRENAAAVNGMVRGGYQDSRGVKEGDTVSITLSQDDYDQLRAQAQRDKQCVSEGLVPGGAGVYSVDPELFLSTLLERGLRGFRLLEGIGLSTHERLPGEVKINGE